MPDDDSGLDDALLRRFAALRSDGSGTGSGAGGGDPRPADAAGPSSRAARHVHDAYQAAVHEDDELERIARGAPLEPGSGWGGVRDAVRVEREGEGEMERRLRVLRGGSAGDGDGARGAGIGEDEVDDDDDVSECPARGGGWGLRNLGCTSRRQLGRGCIRCCVHAVHRLRHAMKQWY
jgi:hypothetical protein